MDSAGTYIRSDFRLSNTHWQAKASSPRKLYAEENVSLLKWNVAFQETWSNYCKQERPSQVDIMWNESVSP
jgi:hypothetical protein